MASTLRVRAPRLIVVRPVPNLMVVAMDVFTKLFGNLLAFVYHCFDRIVIHGYLSALSRPEQVVHFVRKVSRRARALPSTPTATSTPPKGRTR